MQPASEAWITSNSRAFTTPSNVAVTIEKPGGGYFMCDNSRIISYKHEANGDLLCGIISNTKITVKLDNRDGVLGNGWTDSTSYSNCKMQVVYGFKRPTGNVYDSIRGGTYYISGYENDVNSNTVTITAVDILSLLTNIMVSTFTTPQSAFVFVEMVKSQSNASNIVPTVDLQIDYDDDFFRTVDFVFTSESKRTCREVLQLIANACKCVLYTDRNDTIHIEPINKVLYEDYSISANVQYSKPKLEFDNPVNGMVMYSNNAVTRKAEDPDITGRNQIVENEALYSPLGDLYSAELLEYFYDMLEQSRVTYSGTWRADPRLDLFDVITVYSDGVSEPVCITSFTYSFSGAWHGTYKAKSIHTVSILPIIPAMTSYTTPSGTVIESGHYGDRVGYRAFDGVDDQTYANHAWTDGTNALDGSPDSCYVGYIWDSEQTLTSVKISFYADYAYTACVQFRINGAWETGISDIPIAVRTAGAGYYSVFEHSMAEPVTCDGIRLCVLSGRKTYFAARNYGGNVCEFTVYGYDDD